MSTDDASELDGVDLVGLRVSCYWDGEDKFYSGVVRDYVKSKYKPYFVSYDDGEECWEPRKNMQVITKFPRSAKRKSQAVPSSVCSGSPAASVSSASRRPSSAHSSSSISAAATAVQKSARDARNNRARSPMPTTFPSSSPNAGARGNVGRRKSAPHALSRKTSTGSFSDGRRNNRRGSGDSGGTSSVGSSVGNKRRGSGDSGGSSSVVSSVGVPETTVVKRGRGRPPKLNRGSSSTSKQTTDTNETASVTSNSSNTRRNRPRNVNTSNNINYTDTDGDGGHRVGQAVKVYWEGDDLWYHGKVKSIRPSGDVVVLYKDDEEAEENMDEVVVVGDDEVFVDSLPSPGVAGHKRRRESLSERSFSSSSSISKHDNKTKRGVVGGRSKRKATEEVGEIDKQQQGMSDGRRTRNSRDAAEIDEQQQGMGDGRRKRKASIVVEETDKQQQEGSNDGRIKRKTADTVEETDKQQKEKSDDDATSDESVTDSAIEIARKKRRARYEATKEAAKEATKAGLASNNQKKKTRSCGGGGGDESITNTLDIETSAAIAAAIAADVIEEKDDVIKEEETKTETEIETKPTTLIVDEESHSDGRFRRGPSNLDWTVEVSVNATKDSVGDAHKVIGCVLTYNKTQGYLVLFRCEIDKSKGVGNSSDKTGIARVYTSDGSADAEDWGMLWVNDRNKIVFMLRTNKGAGRGQVAEALKHAPEHFTNILVNERIAPIGMHIQLMGHTRIRPLAVAAMRGHVTTVRSLLKLGADPKRNGSDGNSAIMWACKHGQCGIVRELVVGSSAMRSQLASSSSSDIGAEKSESEELQKYLVDINAENKSGFTALMIAAIAGKADVVRTLVELKADLDVVDTQSEKSALMHACAAQQLEVAAVLVAAGASVGAEAQAMSALVQHAMMTGKRDLARDLWTGMVKGKKKPNGVLWMAVQCNVVEFVTDLLDTGEDPNKSVRGKFPLMEAIEQDNVTIVNALLNAGATLTQTVNSEGHSLFAWACGRALSAELVRRLVSAAVLEGESSSGDTDNLQRAVESGSSSSVKAEAVAPADGVKTELGNNNNNSINNNNNSNNNNSSNKKRRLCSKGSPSLLQDGLMNAIESNQEETVAEMVRAGVPIDEHHENGWTALMQACFHGQARIAKRLIDAGAAVNHTNVSGQSALMFACVAGHDTVVKVLVEHNVDCNVTDSGGLSPLMWAIRFCRQEVVNTLIAGGADVNHKVIKSK